MCYYDKDINQSVNLLNDYVDILENLWKNNLTKTDIKDHIPLKIHWIWLSKNINDNTFYSLLKFKDLINSWFKFNPNCEFHLWTNYNSLEISLNKNIFLHKHDELQEKYPILSNVVKTHPNVGIRSDILRMLILNEYGGLYCDINDTECFRSLENELKKYSFIAGLEPNLMINNAIVGSVANGKIIVRFIKYLEYITDTLNDFSWSFNTDLSKDNIEKRIINQTGPVQLTKIVYGCLIDKCDNVMIYPSKFLYTNFQVNNRPQNTWLLPISFTGHNDNKSFL